MKVNCPGCSRNYKVDDHRIPESGLKMRCPKCGESFQVTRDGATAPAAPTVPPESGRQSLKPKRPAKPSRIPRTQAEPSPSIPPVLAMEPDAGADPAADLPAPAGGIDLPVPKPTVDDPFGGIDLSSPAGGVDLPVPKPEVRDPFGGVDVASPAGGIDLPAPKPAAKDPFGGVDLSSPADGIDLPTPKPATDDPFGGVDLPGPVGSVDLPTPKAAAADPFGGVDLPGPVGEADLPTPKAGTQDPFDEFDLPSPAGAVDAPASKPQDAFGEIDLPAPSAGVADLPTPATGVADLPTPATGVADLPTPSIAAQAPAPPGGDAFGEIDLPTPSVGVSDLPTPSVGVSDLPTPSVGVSDLPTPSVGVSDLPTPSVGVADLPTPTAGVSDLPEPAQSLVDLPEPAGGVTDLPDLTDELDSLGPAPPPTPQSVGRTAGTGSTDYGEIDLSPSAPEASAKAADEFDAFPTRSSTDDISLGGEQPDSIDLAVDPHAQRRTGALIDEAVPEQERADQDRKSGAKFDGRRRYERQKRRGKVVLLGILLVAALGGGALYFTPWGPFGAYAIVKLLPSASSDKVVTQVSEKTGRRLQSDTFHDIDAAISELDLARREHGDDEDLRLLGVFLHNWHQLRFGESKQHDTAATKLLGAINLQESESRFALLASSTRDLLALKIPKVIQDLKTKRGGSADALAVLTEAHLLAGNPDKALAMAKKLTAKEKSARSRYMESRALIQSGRNADAVTALEENVAANPRHTDSALALAELLGEREDIDRERVAKLLSDVIESPGKLSSNAHKARAHALLGRLYFIERHYTKSGSEFDQAAELNSKDVVLLVGRGLLALLNDDLAGASSAFIKALAEDPTALGALLGQAETMLRQGLLSDAKASLNAVLPKHPNNARTHYLLGRVELALKNMEAAEKEFGTAIALAKDYLEAYVALSELYLKTGRDQEAMRTLDEAGKTVPDSALIKLTLADGHATRGDYASAIVELGRAIDLEPDNVRAHFRMGQMYRKMGDYEDAAAAYKEVSTRAPNHPGLALEQGLLMELTGKVDDAIAAYERALAVNPKDIGAKVRVGAASLLKGKYTRAKEILYEAVTGNPKSAEANFYLGEVHRLSEHPAEAVAYLKIAAEIDDANYLYHLRYGAALLDLRDMPNATREFDRARELEPEAAEVYMRIGESRLRGGAARDAIVELDKALDLDPKLAPAYGLIGEAFEQLANLKSATGYYRRAVREIPDSAELHFKLGVAELQTSGPRAAAGSLARAVSLAQKLEDPPAWLPEAYYRLGTTQRTLGKRQAAIDAFKRYLEIAPENAMDRSEVEAHLDELGST